MSKRHEILEYAKRNPHVQIQVDKEVVLDIPGEDDGGAWFLNGILVEGLNTLYEGDFIKYKKGPVLNKQPTVIRWPFTFGNYTGPNPWDFHGDN
jgi:hypothetical protein